MNQEELLSILIKLSRVDDHFDEFELGYLLKVGHHLGINNDRVEEMIKRPVDMKINIPSSEEKRMQVLYYLLFLMKVDNFISEEEVESIHHYGFMLGFPKPMIDEFIDVMNEHRFRQVPTEVMLKIIRKYQN